MSKLVLIGMSLTLLALNFLCALYVINRIFLGQMLRTRHLRRDYIIFLIDLNISYIMQEVQIVQVGGLTVNKPKSWLIIVLDLCWLTMKASHLIQIGKENTQRIPLTTGLDTTGDPGPLEIDVGPPNFKKSYILVARSGN